MRRTREQTVVVGAGAVGSATAYQLAKRGVPVLLLEQYALGHDRGSSHGAARITRHSYADPTYAFAMPDAFQAWRELEADAAQPLYIRTGVVSFCPKTDGYVDAICANLAMIDVTHARIDGARWNAQNPLFNLPDDYQVVFEPDAGLLLASRALQAMQTLAAEGGARILPHTRVEQIRAAAGGVELECRSHAGDAWVIEADRVVVAAGGWIGSLLPDWSAHLIPTLQHVFYLEPVSNGQSSIGQLPAFIFHSPDAVYYGMPDMPGSGVKAARDGGPPLHPEAQRITAGDDLAGLRDFLEKHIAGLANQSVISEETCIYTMQRDLQFVVGALPGSSNLFIASPCSGHGFKFCCLVGKVVARLLCDQTPIPNGWLSPSNALAKP